MSKAIKYEEPGAAASGSLKSTGIKFS
jgi:hypothetical protein